MFLCFPSVHAFDQRKLASISSLHSCYLMNCLREFRQIYNFGALEDYDELTRV